MSEHKLIEAKRLKGFRDYDPTLMAARLSVVNAVRKTARLAGFQEVSTPALEYLETLLGQGEETDKQVYQFTDHGGRKVGLRFDLTVPFARYAAEHQGELILPFKRLQIGDVWRGENTQKGRYREFGQCDLDIVGADSVAADSEILLCFARILGSLPAGACHIGVGFRPLLSALIQDKLGPLTPEEETAAIIAIDKLAKIGQDGVAQLLQNLRAKPHEINALLQVLSTTNHNHKFELFKKVAAEFSADGPWKTHLERWEQIVTLTTHVLEKQDAASRVEITPQLGIARGLSYYTGIVFETTLADLPGFGSICSGGRYNDLVGRFIRTSLPGVGGSIGLDRLVAALEEMKRVTPHAAAFAHVLSLGEECLSDACLLTSALREAGVPTDLGVGTGKIGTALKNAHRLGCTYALLIGSEEREKGTVNLKNLATQEEEKGLLQKDAVQKLKSAYSVSRLGE